MLAVPPPLSDTCRPGAGRFAVLATLAFPPFPILPPEVLPVAELVPGFPPEAVLPVVPVPVLPVVPVLATPDLAPVVVPVLDPDVDECVPVPGRDPAEDECVPAPVDGRAVDGCGAGAECAGAAGFGAGGGDDFF